MDYLNELVLKKELVLVNNSKMMETDKDIKEHDNRKILDEIISVYVSTNDKKKKIELEERFSIEVDKTFIKNYSSEKFGEYVLLMIDKMLTKHFFSGYTQEYKDDFKVDAIEKIFKYKHNFNPLFISERSGNRVKAFAYITQIIFQSFFSVINKHKQNREKMKNIEFVSNSLLMECSVSDELLTNVMESTYVGEDEKIDEYFVSSYNDIKFILFNVDGKHISITYSGDSMPLDFYENEILKIKDDLGIETLVIKQDDTKDDGDDEW